MEIKTIVSAFYFTALLGGCVNVDIDSPTSTFADWTGSTHHDEQDHATLKCGAYAHITSFDGDVKKRMAPDTVPLGSAPLCTVLITPGTHIVTVRYVNSFSLGMRPVKVTANGKPITFSAEPGKEYLLRVTGSDTHTGYAEFSLLAVPQPASM